MALDHRRFDQMDLVARKDSLLRRTYIPREPASMVGLRHPFPECTTSHFLLERGERHVIQLLFFPASRVLRNASRIASGIGVAVNFRATGLWLFTGGPRALTGGLRALAIFTKGPRPRWLGPFPRHSPAPAGSISKGRSLIKFLLSLVSQK